MKLSQLLQMVPSLQAIGNTKLPIKASYRFAKNLNLIKAELEVYNEARLKLFKELGTSEDGGMNLTIKPENLAAFNEQHASLVAEECALALVSVQLADLGDVSIEPVHLAALSDILIEGE